MKWFIACIKRYMLWFINKHRENHEAISYEEYLELRKYTGDQA